MPLFGAGLGRRITAMHRPRADRELKRRGRLRAMTAQTHFRNPSLLTFATRGARRRRDGGVHHAHPLLTCGSRRVTGDR
ncbi:MAG: hypothetical protein R2713_17065 [Ilumatobacteraceae bacterium]